MKIAIASGKGGTGKTFISTNLFKIMESSGLDVTLADCDTEVPNDSIFVKKKLQDEWRTDILCPEIDKEKCTFCGACAEFCNYNAITCVPAAGFITIAKDLCHSCGACLMACRRRAITPGIKKVGKVSLFGKEGKNNFLEGRIREGQNSSVPVIRDVKNKAGLNNSEYLILDAPPGCTCPFVNTVMDADKVLLVTEPTPFGLSDLKHTVSVLRQMKKNFSVIINRADLGDDSMRHYLNEENIDILAEIPYSEDVAAHYAKGETVVDDMPDMRELFKNLMKHIIEKD